MNIEEKFQEGDIVIFLRNVRTATDLIDRDIGTIIKVYNHEEYGWVATVHWPYDKDYSNTTTTTNLDKLIKLANHELPINFDI